MTPFVSPPKSGYKLKPKRKRRRKRWRFLWTYHSNGYTYPSNSGWWEFEWGKFAALIAVGTATLLITFFLLDIFGVL
jgi:hypothetical protein